MYRKAIRSSNLVSAGWEKNVLEVQFHNNTVYQYYGVPKNIYEDMMRSFDIGKYFRQVIYPAKIQYRRVH